MRREPACGEQSIGFILFAACDVTAEPQRCDARRSRSGTGPPQDHPDRWWRECSAQWAQWVSTSDAFRAAFPHSAGVETQSERTQREQEDQMGMLYKRGAVWWIKYYRNGCGMRES
jgi:hypothetical protein